MAAVSALLADASFQRDMLIEYLHILQDHDKHLSAEKLAALRGTTAEEIQEITTNNALKMLGKRARIIENALNATNSS